MLRNVLVLVEHPSEAGNPGRFPENLALAASENLDNSKVEHSDKSTCPRRTTPQQDHHRPTAPGQLAVRALPASALQRRQLTTALWHAARLSVLSAQRASSARELQLTVPSRSAWKGPRAAQAAATAHNVSAPGALAEPWLRHAATSCTLDALVALERLQTASNRFICVAQERRIKEGIDGRSH